MEIKINKAFNNQTDLSKCTDNQKVFLSVVSQIYENVEVDNYIFFTNNDLKIMIGIGERWDPRQDWTQKNNLWFFDTFDYMFIDYQNIGIKPKKLNKRHGWEFAGRPDFDITINDEKAQMMFWYLLGIFSNNQVTEYSSRDRMRRNEYRVHKDYARIITDIQKRKYTT